MALPLEPDIGEEDEVLDPFINAPEVRSLAMDVASQWDEFAALRDALGREEGALRMAFVFETKPFVEGEVVKTHTIAKVTKASPMWAFLGDVDVVVQFRMPFWEHFDERQRRAVLHHELSHIEFPRGKLGLRDHDVEDFVGTIRRYGPYLPSRKSFIRAGQIWADENPDEPDDLDDARARRRPPEPSGPGLMDRVMDDVVDRVNAGELGPNVTAHRGRGRPAVLPGERIRRAEEAGGDRVH